jgi:hypothetical protein
MNKIRRGNEELRYERHPGRLCRYETMLLFAQFCEMIRVFH